MKIVIRLHSTYFSEIYKSISRYMNNKYSLQSKEEISFSYYIFQKLIPY